MSDIDKIKKLRKSTGAGFKDCNAALKESNGDLNKAAEMQQNNAYIYNNLGGVLKELLLLIETPPEGELYSFAPISFFAATAIINPYQFFSIYFLLY